MSAELLNGKLLAQDLREVIKSEVTRVKALGVTPGLAVVLVGDDPASLSYVTAKEKACHEAGMHSRDIRLPRETTEAQMLDLVRRLNADPEIDGILVQLPLPSHIDSDKVLLAIDPSKDVDGFHPVSVGKMLLGQDTFLPCTPHGIIKLLEKTALPLPGKEVVVVGRSAIVGKPIALLLMQAPYHCTVTVCHTKTRDLKAHTLRADILIAAAGRPMTITADMVKPGAVVIDVGVNRVENPTSSKGFSLVGDTDYEAVRAIASFITPVPGGVGPMTITMLMYNTLKSACLKNGLPLLS